MSHRNPNVYIQTVSLFNNPKDDTIIQIYIETDINSNVLLPWDLP